MRINKYLSSIGFCSRREADRLLSEGRITVDGILTDVGADVSEHNEIKVDGKIIGQKKSDDILIAFNKPVGIVCTTTDKQGDNNIVDYIGYKTRIYPIGRLDKDSDGLILLTNNGDIMDKILRSTNGHEKEYVVEVDKKINSAFINKMAGGIYLKELDRTTNKCRVRAIDDRHFNIILTQGLNRQIRRMCAECGYKVKRLTRIRIMNILLGDLKTGEYRNVTDEEKKKLTEQLNRKI